MPCLCGRGDMCLGRARRSSAPRLKSACSTAISCRGGSKFFSGWANALSTTRYQSCSGGRPRAVLGSSAAASPPSSLPACRACSFCSCACGWAPPPTGQEAAEELMPARADRISLERRAGAPRQKRGVSLHGHSLPKGEHPSTYMPQIGHTTTSALGRCVGNPCKRPPTIEKRVKG